MDTVKARKLAYCGHTMRKQRSCLEKEIMQRTTAGARRRGRQRTAWMDNNTWSGLPVKESMKMTEINVESTSMVWPTLGSRIATEQNKTKQLKPFSFWSADKQTDASERPTRRRRLYSRRE